MSNAGEASLDFFVGLGDTIYADYPSPALPTAQATTLDEFRTKHAEVYASHAGSKTFADLPARPHAASAPRSSGSCSPPVARTGPGVVWEFVMLPEPIQNLGLLGASDRYEGYVHERTELLKFVDDHDIDPLGLDANLPQADGLIDAMLLEGDPMWRPHLRLDGIFHRSRHQARDRHAVRRGRAYTPEETAAGPAAIAARAPRAVSEFQVDPQRREAGRTIKGMQGNDVLDGGSGNDVFVAWSTELSRNEIHAM